MNILVTGADGFIGKNLLVRLKEFSDFAVSTYVRGDSQRELAKKIVGSDAIFHLAGENRPRDNAAFEEGNSGLTCKICSIMSTLEKPVPIIMTSSIHAGADGPYGKSKLAAEGHVESLTANTNNPAIIYRLPGVFGKWCKPNYNSVVATFCHNIVNDLPLRIDNKNSLLKLVYIDDVVSSLLMCLEESLPIGITRKSVAPEYQVAVGDIANKLKEFKESRENLVLEGVGTGFTRALYSTYISHLPTTMFTYSLQCHEDKRGMFVEMLKTKESGQFSFFSAHPGVTRGGHYHHTKTEKFLVIKGTARFCFREIVTDEYFKIETFGAIPTVVESVPGWSHDITNIGDDELLVMLWANEVFDPAKPDTIMSKLENEKT
mgnify:CR=1 FL=1|jgi:UDP-2-acetamido-2,6-beta-L-arabino-hexul-4-ose reductase